MDMGRLALRRHNVAALIEIDVTETRKYVRRLRRELGLPVSLNAWIIKMISRTLEAHPSAHGFRRGKRRVVSPKAIHITTMVERELEEGRVPLVYVLRNSESKSAEAITAELETRRDESEGSPPVLLDRKTRFQSVAYSLFPAPVRRVLWRYLLANPRRTDRIMGSALVTNISMMGSVRGWFIQQTIHPLSVGIGAIVKKPAVVAGAVVPREFMHMSLIMDHDVIDGAPMARFVQELVRNIESPEGRNTDAAL
jgi:pyruvate/2-oxoglutarate dehydrogenase complex dihydrolipoamide acyltransferase (E2) component